jgi:YHS domain-containing protein
MRFLLRLLAIVAGFLLLRSLLAPLIKAIIQRISPARSPEQAEGGRASELMKDPVCGAFVAPELAIIQKFNGKVVHFCSQKCRDEYAKAAS